MKSKDSDIEYVAAFLKLAGIIVFLCVAIERAINVDHLQDANGVADDTIAALCFDRFGTALLYGGVLFGLGWVISLIHERTRD